MKIGAIKNFSFQRRIQDSNPNPLPIKKMEAINEEKAVLPRVELAKEIDDMFANVKTMQVTSGGVVDSVQDEIEDITRTYKSEVKEALKLFREACDNVEVDNYGTKTIRELNDKDEPKRTLVLRTNGNLTIEDFENNVVVKAQNHELLSVAKNEENTEEGKKYSYFIEYENGAPQSYVKNYSETTDGKITADKKFEFTRGVVYPFRYRENYQASGDTSSADKQVYFKTGGFDVHDLLAKGILFRWADLVREYDENINYGKDFWTIDKAITFVNGDLEKYAESTTHVLGGGEKSDKQLLFRDNKPVLYFDKVAKPAQGTRTVESTYALEDGAWVPSKKWHT